MLNTYIFTILVIPVRSGTDVNRLPCKFLLVKRCRGYQIFISLFYALCFYSYIYICTFWLPNNNWQLIFSYYFSLLSVSFFSRVWKKYLTAHDQHIQPCYVAFDTWKNYYIFSDLGRATTRATNDDPVLSLDRIRRQRKWRQDIIQTTRAMEKSSTMNLSRLELLDVGLNHQKWWTNEVVKRQQKNLRNWGIWLVQFRYPF